VLQSRLRVEEVPAMARVANYLFGAVVLLSIGAGIAFWMPLP
jgi:hypothetical protein